MKYRCIKNIDYIEYWYPGTKWQSIRFHLSAKIGDVFEVRSYQHLDLYDFINTNFGTIYEPLCIAKAPVSLSETIFNDHFEKESVN